MSGLLIPSFESMKETAQAIQAAGLHGRVKIIAGGGIVTELVKRHTGADAHAGDGLEKELHAINYRHRVWELLISIDSPGAYPDHAPVI